MNLLEKLPHKFMKPSYFVQHFDGQMQTLPRKIIEQWHCNGIADFATPNYGDRGRGASLSHKIYKTVFTYNIFFKAFFKSSQNHRTITNLLNSILYLALSRVNTK